MYIDGAFISFLFSVWGIVLHWWLNDKIISCMFHFFALLLSNIAQYCISLFSSSFKFDMQNKSNVFGHPDSWHLLQFGLVLIWKPSLLNSYTSLHGFYFNNSWSSCVPSLHRGGALMVTYFQMGKFDGVKLDRFSAHHHHGQCIARNLSIQLRSLDVVGHL